MGDKKDPKTEIGRADKAAAAKRRPTPTTTNQGIKLQGLGFGLPRPSGVQRMGQVDGGLPEPMMMKDWAKPGTDQRGGGKPVGRSRRSSRSSSAPTAASVPTWQRIVRPGATGRRSRYEFPGSLASPKATTTRSSSPTARSSSIALKDDKAKLEESTTTLLVAARSAVRAVGSGAASSSLPCRPRCWLRSVAARTRSDQAAGLEGCNADELSRKAGQVQRNHHNCVRFQQTETGLLRKIEDLQGRWALRFRT